MVNWAGSASTSTSFITRVHSSSAGGGELLQTLRGIKAKPHHTYIIGGDAGKPTVVVSAGGTGLAAHLNAIDGSLPAGTGFYNAGQQLDHIVPGLGGHGHRGDGGVVQQQLVVCVIYFGIEDGSSVLAFVDKSAVGRRHFQNGDAGGQRAHGQGRNVLVAVGLDTAVAEGLLHGGNQLQPQVFGSPVKGAIHTQLLHQIHRHGVVGFCDTVEDGGAAAVGTAFVVGPAGAVATDGKVLGRVIHHCDGADQIVFQCRGVNGDGLDGRTGASVGLGGAVEHQIAFLLAAAAVKCLYVTGIGIHQHHGGLGIGTVIAQTAGEVVFIQENRVHFGLNFGIQGGDDLQTAGEQQLLRHAFAVAQLGLQIFLDRPVNGIHEVALVFFTGAVIVLAGVFIGLNIFFQRLFPLTFTDVAVFFHLAQHNGPALGILFGEPLQVIAVGIFNDAGDGGTFRQRQLVQLLVEIGLGRLLHTVRTLAEVDGVQVHLQDVVLFILLLQFQRTHDLTQLALDRSILVIGEVFDQLLGDGTAAAGEVVQHTCPVDGSADGALPVDTLVGVEAVVLHRDKGQLQLLGDVLQIHPNTVFHAVQRAELYFFTGFGIGVVDKAGQVQPVAVQIDLHIIADVFVDVDGKHHAADGGGGQSHQQNGQDQEAQRPEGAKSSSRIAQNQNSFHRQSKTAGKQGYTRLKHPGHTAHQKNAQHKGKNVCHHGVAQRLAVGLLFAGDKGKIAVIQRRFGGDDQHLQQGIERDKNPGGKAVEIGVQVETQVEGQLGQHIDLCEQQQRVPVVITEDQRYQQLHRHGQCHADQQPQQLAAPLIAFVQYQTAILYFGSVIAVISVTLMNGACQIFAGLGEIKQHFEGLGGIIGPFQRMVGAVPPFLQEIVAVCILIGCESLPDRIVAVPGAVIAILPAPFGLVVGAVGFILGEQGAVNRTFR